MYQIIETTDRKYIGLTFSKIEDLKLPDGYIFKAVKVQDLGYGITRYSNTNYSIATKES